MKEQILKMRSEGKTYDEIALKLGCSKSTVAYHCSPGQKEKNQERQRRRRKDNVLDRKVENFKRKLSHKSSNFQGRSKRTKNFSPQDVIDKFGLQTKCYLTGDPIDLCEPNTYHFDHIVPHTRGGTNDLDNLGIALVEANKAKNDLMIDEFLALCKKVLENNGYIVRKG